MVQGRHVRSAVGPWAATEPADHGVTELPFQSLPQPDGSVRLGAFLLRSKAPPGAHYPHLQPGDGRQGVELNPPAQTGDLRTTVQDNLSPPARLAIAVLYCIVLT